MDEALQTRCISSLHTTFELYPKFERWYLQRASSLAGTTSNSGSELMLKLQNKGNWVEAARLALDFSLGSSPHQVPGGDGSPGGPGAHLRKVCRSQGNTSARTVG